MSHPALLHDANKRSDERKALFVAALLAWNEVSAPVRIRNISANGAMVEGDPLPHYGSPIRLVRADLSVCGRVVWAAGRRCGLEFDHEVSVPSWAARLANPKQGLVDRMVAAVQAGVETAPAGDMRPQSAADDLRTVRRLVDGLGDALSDDPDTLARHMVALQAIDRTLQVLDALEQKLD